MHTFPQLKVENYFIRSANRWGRIKQLNIRYLTWIQCAFREASRCVCLHYTLRVSLTAGSSTTCTRAKWKPHKQNSAVERLYITEKGHTWYLKKKRSYSNLLSAHSKNWGISFDFQHGPFLSSPVFMPCRQASASLCSIPLDKKNHILFREYQEWFWNWNRKGCRRIHKNS